MSPEFARHRRRIGGLLASGRLPWDYKPEVAVKTFGPEAMAAAQSIANYCLTRFPCDTPPHPMLDVPWFAEKVQKAIDEAGRQETKQLEAALKLNADLRTAAEEMLAAIEAEYATGVKNGYWPTVAAKLDRWRTALGLPPLERFQDKGGCGVKYHHRDCDCNGEGGGR